MVEAVFRSEALLGAIVESGDRELVEKHILLGTIVYEWARRCQELNYVLTNYTLKQTAQTLAKIIEIKDFKPNATWVLNFQDRFKIKCAPETPEVLCTATAALHAVNIYDVVRDFRTQNKFPESIRKVYDRKFQYTNVSGNSSNLIIENKRKSNVKNNNDSAKILKIVDVPITASLIHENSPKENTNQLENFSRPSTSKIINSTKNNLYNRPRFNNEENLNSLRNDGPNNFDKQYVTTDIDLESINSYDQALKHLKLLEDFALLKCNYRAINFINNLQEIFKNPEQ